MSDVLTVTVRTGQGNQYQILRTISTGTQVEVMEESETGYSRVRLRDGTQGWVLSRYLTDEPVAREKLTAVQERVASLSTQNARLRDQLQAVREERANLEQQVQRAEEQRSQLAQENSELRDLAARPQEIQEQNQALQRRVAELRERMGLLEDQNRQLRDDRRRDWFLAGAGVLLGGIILGVIFGRMQLRRRDTLFRS
ncbi:MAG: TIGR04211 family SH3 domain-containing protein [Gammaproteobacteria bacterium]|nr:TIGR04211 family SH3 domain-containing protein [Gammaproteobacteria bacterium]NIR85124.1 TIGR04211 family SH3 domain-containing protein [Gammaproteobacteria bacterium]NIR92053.1 TIGR04211 family SH3 domain-containing protein [Gammaproteobacteria bacterium]NIU06173.1 TIGR04211 family SH3 domain-containing protein [Gammaproteobacteria bacterium]NIX87446.1 TIGR04211 family SH3 domain-containing protein [Gammaproteobacteria bacterium]